MDLYNNESAEKRLRQSSTYMHWAFLDVLTNLSDVFSADFLSELPSMRLLPKRPQDKEGRTLIHVSQVYVRGKMHTVKTACSPQKGMPKEKDNSNLLRALYMPTTLDLRVLREKNIWKSRRVHYHTLDHNIQKALLSQNVGLPPFRMT